MSLFQIWMPNCEYKPGLKSASCMKDGTTFVYVTHDQVEAMTMATSIAVLNLGVLQQVGEPQELYDRPANMFVAGFIGSPSMNFFEVQVEKDGDNACCLATSGFKVPIPEEKREKLSPYIGETIVLGIRPEDIHMPDYTPTGIIASPVEAEVDVIEAMGNEMYLHLISGDKPFLARVDPRARARPGQTIKVVFNMANMHAFETTEGKAIAH